MVGLSELAHFTVRSLERGLSQIELTGTFDHLRGVLPGRAWLHVPEGRSIEGELTFVDRDHRVGRMEVVNSMAEDLQPLTSLPYFYGSWEPSDVEVILDQHREWVRIKYSPTDSVRIRKSESEGQVIGEREQGTPIPDGFHVFATVPGGWEKEACLLCREKIGRRFQRYGYRDIRDANRGRNSSGVWLCERDYLRHASRHDLSFLL